MLYHIYIASLIKIVWPKHVVDVDKLYIPDNIVVLRLLQPYGIITFDITVYILIIYQ